MTVGQNVALSAPPPEKEPGYTIDTFSNAEQEAYLNWYHEKYPEVKPSAASMANSREEVYEPPPHYSDHFDHHLNFALAIRSRKPVVEDAVFGFRAAGPALLSNVSYFEKRIVEWDPLSMEIKS